MLHSKRKSCPSKSALESRLPEVKSLIEKQLPEVTVNIFEIEGVRPLGQETVAGAITSLSAGDIERLKDAEIVILNNSLLPLVAYSLPNLKWAQGTYAGVNRQIEQMADELAKGNYPQSVATRCTGDSSGKLMLEYCLHFMIGHERGFTDHMKLKPSKDWMKMKQATPSAQRLVQDLTITVLGVGALGTVLTKSFKKLGCTVKGFSKNGKTQEFLDEAGIDTFSTTIDDVVTDTDYIVNVLPDTPETIGFLNDKFKACNSKPGFINLGRGTVIAEASLIEALDEGHLSFAALDVYEKEPLPLESNLWLHPKVLMTPHMAAITRAQDLVEVFVENYQLYVKGEKMLYAIDWKAGY
ncbi:Glyoxylate/hydroxypyruvate reductase A [Halotydeus destructor]|nr:Glyoxylate/hydroxypyruvate reductase A [Halotydeus destructor]